MTKKRELCPGIGQPVEYRRGSVHPICAGCGADLSTQGKRKKTRWRDGGYVAERHYRSVS